MDIVVLVSSKEIDIAFGVETLLQRFNNNIGPAQSEDALLGRCSLGVKVFNAAINDGRQFYINSLRRTVLHCFCQRYAEDGSDELSSIARAIDLLRLSLTRRGFTVCLLKLGCKVH